MGEIQEEDWVLIPDDDIEMASIGSLSEIESNQGSTELSAEASINSEGEKSLLVNQNEEFIITRQRKQKLLHTLTYQEYISTAQKQTMASQTNEAAGPEWILTHDHNIPPNAIDTGHESNGELLYSARAFHKNAIHLGKTSKVMQTGCAIPYHHKEIYLEEFEILVGNQNAVKWIEGSLPFISTNLRYKNEFLVCGGVDKPGRSGLDEIFHKNDPIESLDLFIAQAVHEGGIHPGKVNRDKMYISYNGVEIEKSDFKVLCYDFEVSDEFRFGSGSIQWVGFNPSIKEYSISGSSISIENKFQSGVMVAKDKTGKGLYLGRTKIKSHQKIGLISQLSTTLEITYKHKSYKLSSFELLQGGQKNVKLIKVNGDLVTKNGFYRNNYLVEYDIGKYCCFAEIDGDILIGEHKKGLNGVEVMYHGKNVICFSFTVLAYA
jgi:hypothetical protein